MPFSGDTLEPCLLHLDTYWLHLALQASRGFCAGSKSVVTTSRWQASHFDLRELLSCDGFIPLWRGNVVALHPEAILLRLQLFPLEATTRLDATRWPRMPQCSRPPPRVRFVGETVPLHLAAHHQAGRAVVMALLQMDGAAIRQRTDAGFLPIHLASMFHRPDASTETLIALIEADPEAVKMFTGLLGHLTFRQVTRFISTLTQCIYTYPLYEYPCICVPCG